MPPVTSTVPAPTSGPAFPGVARRRSRGTCTIPPRTALCGWATGIGADQSSTSTNTRRPGFSFWAEATSPHTAAPAKSVTGSPAMPTAPLVTTISLPTVSSASQSWIAASTSNTRRAHSGPS